MRSCTDDRMVGLPLRSVNNTSCRGGIQVVVVVVVDVVDAGECIQTGGRGTRAVVVLNGGNSIFHYNNQ